MNEAKLTPLQEKELENYKLPLESISVLKKIADMIPNDFEYGNFIRNVIINPKPEIKNVHS